MTWSCFEICRLCIVFGLIEQNTTRPGLNTFCASDVAMNQPRIRAVELCYCDVSAQIEIQISGEPRSLEYLVNKRTLQARTHYLNIGLYNFNQHYNDLPSVLH